MSALHAATVQFMADQVDIPGDRSVATRSDGVMLPGLKKAAMGITETLEVGGRSSKRQCGGWGWQPR